MSVFADALVDLGKGVAGGLISSNPIGAGLIGIVNAFLGDNEKLDGTATATDILNKIDNLNSEDQRKVMESFYSLQGKKVDLEETKENLFTERFKLMEITNRQSKVRPAIVILFSAITAIITLGLAGSVAWRWAMHGELPDANTSWAFFAILLYIPARVIFKYFDIRTKEKAAMLDGINGNPVKLGGGFMSEVSSVMKEREVTKQTQLKQLGGR